MTREQGTPEDRFEDLVDELVGWAGLTPPPGGSGVGCSALRWEKKIFAMLVRGRLTSAGRCAICAGRRVI